MNALATALLLTAAPAHAFVLATTDLGACDPNLTPDCEFLAWPRGEPVPFRVHYLGAEELPRLATESTFVRAFQAWAAVPGVRLDIVQGESFVGDACPDGDWEGHAADCPTRDPDVDFEPVLLFMEDHWPFDAEIIALTVVSWAEGGVLVDADTAFNAADYDFTWGDEGVEVDLLSIATHEMGHFLGLGHSAVASATMAPSYDPGEVAQRDLDPDDEAGIQWLYPCEDGDCRSGVRWEERCSFVGGEAPLAVLLSLALALGLRRHRADRRGSWVAAGAVIGLLWASSALGSVVLALPETGLRERADLIVRGTVIDTTAYLDGIVRTRVRVRVREDWKGLPPEEIELDLPGGRLGGRGTLAFGMPRFVKGEDVVLFLRWPSGEEPRVVGLEQGVFRVDSLGRLHRRLGEIRTVGDRGDVPEDLAALRRLVVGGG